MYELACVVGILVGGVFAIALYYAYAHNII